MEVLSFGFKLGYNIEFHPNSSYYSSNGIASGYGFDNGQGFGYGYANGEGDAYGRSSGCLDDLFRGENGSGYANGEGDEDGSGVCY